MQNQNSVIKHFDFLIIDLLSLTISFLISYFIKLKDGISIFNRLYLTIYIWMIICGVLYDILFNPYKDVLRRGMAAEFRCTISFIMFNVTFVTIALYSFKQSYYYSRTQLTYTYLLFFVLSIVLRYYRKKKLINAKKENKINVLIVTERDNCNKVVYNIENSEFSEYEIKGIMLTDDLKKDDYKYQLYSGDDNLLDIVVSNNIQEVFAYCEPGFFDKTTVSSIIDKGIDFHLCIDTIFGFEPDNEELSKLAMYQTINFNSFSFTPRQIIYSFVKRALDIIISLFACILLLPLYTVVKISYILVNDFSPILYTQTRIGKNGKEFKLYKFRSMVYNADELLQNLLKNEEIKKEWEENYKLDNDPRVTKIGHILRKTSLDEFPQFVNVLLGDMSIIGPRPLVPGELKKMNGLKLYERVKPGITGWWACNGRSNISYAERMELEYYYVKNFSFGLDALCVLKTIYVVLFQKGAK